MLDITSWKLLTTNVFIASFARTVCQKQEISTTAFATLRLEDVSALQDYRYGVYLRRNGGFSYHVETYLLHPPPVKRFLGVFMLAGHPHEHLHNDALGHRRDKCTTK